MVEETRDCGDPSLFVSDHRAERAARQEISLSSGASMQGWGRRDVGEEEEGKKELEEDILYPLGWHYRSHQ
jgi:hypothetical protein